MTYQAKFRKRRHMRRIGLIRSALMLVIPALVILSAACFIAAACRPDTTVDLPIFTDSSFPSSATSPSTIQTLPLDTLAPQLTLPEEYTVYQGDTICFSDDVCVTDDTDAAPVLEIDSSGVDLNVPGTYQVIFHAADSAGNRTSLTALVTVLPKEDGYFSLDTIYEAADRVLANILTEDMNTADQVRAIYTWARENIRYAGHSDRADWRQSGYAAILDGTGDCYGYFAATKLLLQQLDIPNMDVQKVRNHPDDSDHFWSLVSIDGGKSYYHFDATPRYGDGDDFCLVTDDFLDAYSQAHKGSHNRDCTLYPETPEVPCE